MAKPNDMPELNSAKVFLTFLFSKGRRTLPPRPQLTAGKNKPTSYPPPLPFTVCRFRHACHHQANPQTCLNKHIREGLL